MALSSGSNDKALHRQRDANSRVATGMAAD